MGVLYGSNKGRAVTSTTDGNKERMDVDIGSGGSGSSSGGSNSTYYAKSTGNADAVVAYTSATTLTITGLGFTFAKCDIVSIKQIPSAGGTGAQDTTYSDIADFSVSGDVITVAGASFASDDDFVIVLSGQIKGYDDDDDVSKISNQTPVWNRRTASQAVLSSAQTLTTTVADVGNEICTKGYKKLRLYMTTTINAANDVRIALMAKHEKGGAEECPLDDNFVKISGTTVTAPSTAALYYFEQTEDVNADWMIEIDLGNATSYVLVRAYEGTDGGDDAVINTLDAVLGY